MTAAAGSVKETLGRVVGSAHLQAEGAAKRAQGNAEVNAAKTHGYAQGAGNSASGSMKQHFGRAIGNEGMQARGAATHAKGHAQRGVNHF
ncbi:hypothetical protein HK104_009857 [Borealophlyctis nickersoniae]|nr:hypothetical protein HK104_009857 [Borealophlyctis nickersoniae]